MILPVSIQPLFFLAAAIARRISVSAVSCSPMDGITGPAKLAAKAFDLNPEDMENWHRLTFDTYEDGRLTLEE